MNLLRFVPIKLTVLLVLGILLGTYLQLHISIAICCTTIFSSILGLLFYRDTQATKVTVKTSFSAIFGTLVALTAISIGVLAVSSTLPKNIPGHYSHHDTTKHLLWKVKVREILKPTSYSNRYVAEVRTSENEPSSGKLLVSFPLDTLTDNLEVDDELLAHTKLSAIKPPLNPHQFDYRKYLKNLGILHQMRLQPDGVLIVENPEHTVHGLVAAFRNKILSNLMAADFEKEELGIIQALLLGHRNDISTDTYDDYKNAGAVHILAVSGLHIGILLVLLQLFLRPLEYLPKGKTIKLVVTVILLWGFALLAGLSASIVRAVTMFSFVAYAHYLNRPGNTFNILALSMFFILLVVDPLLIYQVGFQMSYAAVFAIIWMYPLLEKLWSPKNKIIRYFWQLLSVSITAQLGVLPISLFYFHQFPGLFFISNLVIVPALGVIFGLGVFVIVLALFDSLFDSAVMLYGSLIRWMNTIVGWVAEQEAFIFKNISFDAIQLVLAYSILIYGVLFFSRPNLKKAISLATTVILFQSWLFLITYQTRRKETLLLAHQTGNSILLHQTGNRLVALSQDRQGPLRLIADYQVAERTAYIETFSLKNAYQWYDKKILIIDSLKGYPKTTYHPEYLILTGSPKLNLERLIDSLRPKTIIADGSNYKSYVLRWKKTCARKSIDFHSTGDDGTYYLKKY